MTSYFITTVTALAAGLFAASVFGQQYPNKPVRAIAFLPPGSGPDTVLRIVADRLQKSMGQPFVVENRVGANGLIAAEQVKRAAPDGYTLLQVDDGVMAANPFLYKKIPYDAVNDFQPIAMLFQTYFFVVVPIDSPWKSMADLLNAAKVNRGGLTHGTWGIGSIGHLGMAAFESRTNTLYTHVPFQRVTDIYPAVGNKDVNWAFGTVATSGPMFKAGKVRYLAAAAPKRVIGFPDIPTMAESGGPQNFDVRAWVGIYAPRGIPADIVARLNAEIGKALGEPEVRERLNAIGFEPYIATPADMSKALADSQARYGAIIRQSRIALE